MSKNVKKTKDKFEESHEMKKYRSSIMTVLITGILILAQFTWITYLLYWGTTVNQAVNFGLQLAALLIALYVDSRDIRTSQKLSWTFLMLALPIIGVAAYFLFGRPELTKGRRKRMAAVMEESAPYRKGKEEITGALKEENPDAYLQSQYIADFGGYPLHRECTTEYFDSGEAFLPALLEDLKTAEHFILIDFFILGIGEMWGSVLKILEQKVAEGVEIRVIFDDFGSAQVLPKHYDRVLEAKGIRTIRFNPFRPFLSVIMNNRDHHKIVSIDNRIGYTGGCNLSDEYINKVRRFGHWKDAAVRITGPAVNNFTVMFLEFWNYAKKDSLAYTDYLLPNEETAGKGYVQPYADSPLDREYVGENVYMNMINRAHHYVYIATPYLIISSELSAALVNAAKSGVDVRIVVPTIPDKKMVYQLTKSNFRHLTKGGVKIYTYTPGFIHTKCFVADDLYAAIGSINLDYRSLTLHFECGSFHYNTEAVPAVKQDLLEAMEVSHLVSVEEGESKHVVKRTALMILKLFSPML